MSNAAAAVDLTRELIRFDTINPPGNERACAEHLGGLLERAGYAIRYHEFGERRASLVARIGDGSGAPLCFTGHIDTVPLGAMPWSVDPFAAESEGDRLYGRGSSDMKSGVAAFVAVAIALAPRLARSPGLLLVITAGEETGCEGAGHLARVDGALEPAGAIVVAEPTANYPYVGHKGALWLRARTRGVTAHGSMPERGVNAIHKAAQAVAKLERFAFDVPPHPVLGPPTLNVGTIRGGLNINSVPDQAEIGIDIRTIPGQEQGALRAALARHLGDEVELEPIMEVDGVWTEPGHDWIREVYGVMAELLGEQPVARGATYFTDAAALTPACGGPPTVILGPGEPGMAHQTDEYCLISRIEQAYEANLRIAAKWCGL